MRTRTKQPDGAGKTRQTVKHKSLAERLRTAYPLAPRREIEAMLAATEANPKAPWLAIAGKALVGPNTYATAGPSEPAPSDIESEAVAPDQDPDGETELAEAGDLFI